MMRRNIRSMLKNMKKMKMINMNISMINQQNVREDLKMIMNKFHVMKLDNVSVQHVIKYLPMKTHYINTKYYI